MESTRKGRIRSRGLLSIALLFSLILAACAKSTTPSSGGTGSSSGNAKAMTVSTASAGSVGTVLVDSKGMTLYYLGSETPGTIACTSTCAANWPPLVLPAAASSATAGTGVSAADLGTIKRPDGGTQVTYKGRALYLFIGDQNAGQASGQGVSDFFAVTPSAAASAGSSPTSGGGGY
jgi:predicted lipoprotein with Yx(FWY)xxD motif